MLYYNDTIISDTKIFSHWIKGLHLVTLLHHLGGHCVADAWRITTKQTTLMKISSRLVFCFNKTRAAGSMTTTLWKPHALFYDNVNNVRLLSYSKKFTELIVLSFRRRLRLHGRLPQHIKNDTKIFKLSRNNSMLT